MFTSTGVGGAVAPARHHYLIPLLLAGLAAPASSGRELPASAPAAPHHLRETPAGEAPARGGPVVYWGGFDESSGTAVEGGVWDFELEAGQTDPFEGWTSQDLTDEGTFVRRVTAADFAGDPVSGLITEGGSTASLWWGAHENEADAGCWPGGMGYSNDWRQLAAKTFTYSGTGDVTIALDVFADTVDELDRSTVHVVGDLGVVSPPLASYWGDIGTPAAPAHDVIVVSPEHLPSGPGEFQVLIVFESDFAFSDGDGDFGGFLNTVYGPLGVDDIHVTGDQLDDFSDFETGTDGWTLSASPPAGRHLDVRHLDDLEPLSMGCPLSGHVMIAADADAPALPHPDGQFERLISPPAYVGDEPSSETFVQLDVFEDLELGEGVGYRIGVRYYPWICEVTLETGWTIRPVDTGGGFFFGGPGCASRIVDLVGVPASAESLEVVIDVLADCDRFGVPSCDLAGRNQSPYFDNVRLGRRMAEVAVDDPAAAPVLTRLLPNVPNPFNPSTSVRYELATDTHVTLDVYDAVGRHVRTLTDGPGTAGSFSVAWDGRSDAGEPQASGVYWARMRTATGVDARTKLVLLK